jgi:Fe-S-cluster containining protein
MHDPISPLAKNQPFCFTCSPQVACFNACCRDLNQVLSPYDVLCLKQYLNLSSSEFLETYTDTHTGPETGLPVVCLRFTADDDLACPFVTDAGCSVYPARPASCRTYPLARGISRDRTTGRLTEHWAIIREPHCLGFNERRSQTVTAWVADQKIAPHNQMNDMMLELISLKNRFRPGVLGPSDENKVYTALYDLDTFRKTVFSNQALAGIAVDPQVLERSATHDLDLLIAAMAWVGQTIFRLPEKESSHPT